MLFYVHLLNLISQLETWNDGFPSKVGGWGILRYGGWILVMGDDLQIGRLITLYGL